MDATQAEQSLLGSIIIDNTVLPLVSDIVSFKDFYRPVHQEIWQTMKKLDANNKPIDLATIAVELMDHPQFMEAGAIGYLVNITNTTTHTQNVKTYASIVHNDAIRRSINSYAQELVAKTQANVGDCAAYVQGIKDKLDDLVGVPVDVPWVDFETTAKEAIKDIVSLANGEIQGVDTGFADLDRLLCGLRPGSLSIVAARPAMGKTAFALNIIKHVAIDEQTPVAVFTLEMTAKELALRIISSMANVSGHAIRTGKLTQQQWNSLYGAVDKFKQAPIRIDETAGISIGSLRDRARRMKAECGIRFIVIDYLQLMTSGSRRVNSREQEIADISRGLKNLAKDLDVPVLCLAQLNRNVESRINKRPFMSDLRESGSIEQDADNVMFIHREYVYDKNACPTDAEIIIAKQRAGSTGTVELHWNAEITTFSNSTKHEYF